MNRMFFAVAILLIIGACLPSNLLPVSLAQPTVDSSGLTQTSAPAAFSETATLPPTDTAVPVTDTSAPPTESPAASATETATTSPIPNLTTTFATSTEITGAAVENTATLAVAGAETTTSTPSHLTYGTLPPENRPFSQVTLFNRSHAEAYISLQVNNRDFGPTIIEYYVERMVTIRAPVGYYLYVAWVGGNKMVGNFRLSENDDLLITLFADRVVIR
jgi:hypothetical protein